VAWITSETISPYQLKLSPRSLFFNPVKSDNIAFILGFLPVTPYPGSPDNFSYPVSPEDKTAKKTVFVIFSANYPDISCIINKLY